MQTAPLALAPWLSACGRGVNTATSPGPGTGGAAALTPLPADTAFEFRHGVASGDPLVDAVILWTRVTPTPSAGAAPAAASSDAGVAAAEGSTAVDVSWQIALDPQLTRIAQSGQAQTDASADYTLKVDVRDLSPGTTYYYRFGVRGRWSPIGRTRTLPVGHVEHARVAVTSCANYPQGYFHAYRKLAERADLDLVLCLGDYIYEYGNATFGDGAPLGRVPDPDREIVSLDDYRRRHAQYKLDPDLQELHRQHPAVAVWDDHEFTDNAYRDGAANHNPQREGDWNVRKQAAVRAFHEWMPIRSSAEDLTRIYRAFAFGDLIDLVMLDTRLVGRGLSPGNVCNEQHVNDPARHLLGPEQEAWFLAQLAASRERGTRWRLVGQQVAFAQLLGDPPMAGCIGSRDKWAAFGATRGRVLEAIAGGIDNVVILTGDAHSSWAIDVPRDAFDASSYDGATGRGSLAVECICPGVSSPGLEDASSAAAASVRYTATHPHVKYVNQHDQGYVLLDVTHERARAEWYHVSPVRQQPAFEHLGGAAVTLAGQNHWTLPAGLEPAPPRPGAAELAPRAS